MKTTGGEITDVLIEKMIVHHTLEFYEKEGVEQGEGDITVEVFPQEEGGCFYIIDYRGRTIFTLLRFREAVIGSGYFGYDN